ncbi:hypothetical protein [Almyronema epifaneia]|uniref:Uncharacterized protein n=1 Tax=Almyronema epifaneia S1 TaxID=2991925 RepID=A0ABW6IJN9_9CYAN
MNHLAEALIYRHLAFKTAVERAERAAIDSGIEEIAVQVAVQRTRLAVIRAQRANVELALHIIRRKIDG